MTWLPTAKSLILLSVGAISLLTPILVQAGDVVSLAESAIEVMSPAVNWSLRLPTNGKVNYRGVVGFDQAGGGGTQILYPAPNAIGFLAAVITHGVLVESSKNEQKEKLQVEANKVLLPYQSTLDQFDARDLMLRVLKKSALNSRVSPLEQANNADRLNTLNNAPIFSLTQDQKAIILDNTIEFQTPGTTQTSHYQKSIRVVSGAKEVDDPTAYWNSNNGENLKDESAQLVAESLDIALNDLGADSHEVSSPHRTIRFREGASEKIERAQVLSTHCGRLLIRTLRGQLMSVPTLRTAEELPLAENCMPSSNK